MLNVLTTLKKSICLNYQHHSYISIKISVYGKIENTSSQIINKKEVILFNKTLKIMIKKTITLTVSVEITTL